MGAPRSQLAATFPELVIIYMWAVGAGGLLLSLERLSTCNCALELSSPTPWSCCRKFIVPFGTLMPRYVTFQSCLLPTGIPLFVSAS